MFRRFLVVLILMFLVEWPGIQASLLILLSTLNLIILVKAYPFKTKFNNFIEIFNELTILISSYGHFMCLHESEFDEQVQ